MSTIEQFRATFGEESGYLDWGRVGPLSRTVVAESQGMTDLLAKARFGSLAVFDEQEPRMHDAVSALIGMPADQVVTQPNTSMGLMHAMFGLTGDVLLSAGEFPSLPIAAVRASEALQVVRPVWLSTDHGRVTAGAVREQLTDSIAAVAVTLVDSRTGYVTDLDGIRQVIGDRLLIVDAIQGFGVVDAPYTAADVVVSGRAEVVSRRLGDRLHGYERARDRSADPRRIGVYRDGRPPNVWDDVEPPVAGAAAYRVTNPDRIAQTRFAAALEEIHAVGVDVIQAAVAENVERVIDLADEFAIPVVSSRDERERSGLVVLEPPAEQLTLLTASLFNHGVTATNRLGTVRLSVHAELSDDTLGMLEGAFTSYGTAAIY